MATGFPAGQISLEAKLRETADAVSVGADEIDMVISREAFLSGDDARVMDEIARVKDACGDAHLKVILETAELGSYDHIRHASMIAMEAGADFIKTSTGKASAGATPGVCLVMLEAIRDYGDRTGRIVGFKAAGGVSTSKAALHRLVLVKETLGDEWLTPERLRIGASSVLNDLLMQYAKTETGRYGRVGGLLQRNEHGSSNQHRLGLRARSRVDRSHPAEPTGTGCSWTVSSASRRPVGTWRRSTPRRRSRSPRWRGRATRTSRARSSRPAPRSRSGRRSDHSSAASTCSGSPG